MRAPVQVILPVGDLPKRTNGMTSHRKSLGDVNVTWCNMRKGWSAFGLSATLLGCVPVSPTAPLSPSPAPSSTATPVASVPPSASPGGSGSPVSPAPTPYGSSVPGSDAAAFVTVRGLLLDDLGGRVEGATVTATMLGNGAFANSSDALVGTSQVGAYGFTGVPVGATIRIRVAKVGLAVREQMLVPTLPKPGQPDPNTVDFGANGDLVTALSDKPEVIRVSPSQNARGVDPLGAFTLTFSEPMNRADVENAFAIFVSGDAADGPAVLHANRKDLIPLTAGPNLQMGYLTKKDDGQKREYVDVIPFSNRYIYDAAQFTATWSKGDTEVVFAFKPGYQLPVDKDPARVPYFAISFKNMNVRDAGGTGRDKSWFRIQAGAIGRYGYTFLPANDEILPRVTTIRPLNRDEIAGATTQDRILVQFNKIMMIYPTNLPDRDGPGPLLADSSIPDVVNDSNHALSRGSYLYEVASTKPVNGPTKVPQAVEFFNDDPTHTTVALSPAAGSGSVGDSYSTGDNVWVKVNASLRDPAGNTIESSGDANLMNGFSQ